MAKIKREDINILQVMFDRMNSGINLEHEIDTWNHCCANCDEQIYIEENESANEFINSDF